VEEAQAGAAGAEAPAARIGRQIRGSLLLLLGRFLSLALAFATQVLIVRYLSKTDFGAFAYGLSVVAVSPTFELLGFDRAITRFVPIYEERREYGKAFGTLVFATGSVVGLGAALVLLVYAFQGVIRGSLIDDERTVSLLLVLIGLAPIQALDALLVGLFAVFSKPRAIFFRRHVLAPGLRLVVVLLLIGFGSGVTFLAAGYVVAAGLGVALYVGVLLRTLRQEGHLGRFRSAELSIPTREILLLTLPLLTTDLVYSLMNSTDAVLLGHFRGAADVANLRVVQPIAQLNQLVIFSFTLLFTPLAARFFAQDDRESVGNLYWQTAVWVAVISFPVFAVTFALADPLTTTVYGDRYESSGIYLALLSLGYYVQAALGFNGTTLMVFGRIKFIVVVNLLAVVTNLVLTLVLIPPYGALGAAIATATTLVAHNVFKQTGLRLGTGVAFFERRYLGVYVSIGAGMAALALARVIASDSIAVLLVLTMVVTIAVLAVNRRPLRIGETFPELERLPLARRFFGS
jgi:O-antigen/teichoic acid export membrane protein